MSVEGVDSVGVHYGLSRKKAAVLLNVSIRTIDRRIESGKLSTFRRDGRVWLSRDEILNGVVSKKVDMSGHVDVALSSGSAAVLLSRGVDNHVDDCLVSSNIVEKENRKYNIENGNINYRDLYQQLKSEINEKQERLEMANYRVGQLECQVRNCIPMLEYNEEKYNKDIEIENKNKVIKESKELIFNLSKKIKAIKFTKRVFVMILLIILAFQPLWLYFLYK